MGFEPFGVRLVCIEPGFFRTEITANSDVTIDPNDPYVDQQAWMKEFFDKSVEAGGGDPAYGRGRDRARWPAIRRHRCTPSSATTPRCSSTWLRKRARWKPGCDRGFDPRRSFRSAAGMTATARDEAPP